MDGAGAEQLALEHLQRAGLRLLARNYRCRGGELDLVMQAPGELVVVEVRARARNDYGSAAESIDRRKQARLIHATRVLLAERPQLADQGLRFDVVTLDGAGRIEWLRNAFEVSE